jgi:carbonyl reductase 1
MDPRVAVVTGATRGIGEAIAAGLVRRSIHVVVAARDAERGTAVARRLHGTFEDLDVSSAASVDSFAERLDERYPTVDVLVNNAGISLDGFDEQVVRRTLEVNFHGTVRVTERLLPRLAAGARVVMVSSGMGELSCLGRGLRSTLDDPNLDRAALSEFVERFAREVAAGTHTASGWPSSAYRVSKAAMNAYARILARELAGDPRGILVNAACPGWVRTDMGGSSAPRSAAEGAKTPIWLATLPPDGPSGGFFRDERRIPW